MLENMSVKLNHTETHFLSNCYANGDVSSKTMFSTGFENLS